MGMNLFARLTKVDEERRLVYGRATDETVDRAGEIFDYESSKPFFEKWSGDIAKATDGKSLGNVRAMHGNVAAGKLTSIDFNDGEKAIDICSKIVDDNEWGKVLEGLYTGFSIGGSYHKTWMDTEAKARRFTADPCEISIVDLPCNPSAGFFDIQKADGSVMQKAFKPVTADSFSDEVAELVKSGDLSMAEMLEAIRKAKDDKKKPYGDVEYADPKNGKYPIDTEEHIRAAWSYINKEKNAGEYSASELKAIKDKIIAAWKDKIDKDGPPSAADKVVEPVLTKAGKKVVLSSDNLRKVGFVALHKGMDRVGSFAYLLSSVQGLQQGSATEEAREGDDSTMPAELLAWLKQGGDLLAAMVAEEVEEMVDDTGLMCVPDYFYCGWAAAAEGLEKEALTAGGDRKDFLAKVGARNSKADQNRIQAAHDLLAEMGADCDPDNTGEDDAEKAAKAEALAKLTAADESLKKLTSDLAAANEALVKVADERDELAKTRDELTTARDELQKAHDTLTAERDTLQKTVGEQETLIAKLKAEPATPKGALRAIEKSHDLVNEAMAGSEEITPILNKDGTVNVLETAVKKARAAGGVVVQRG